MLAGLCALATLALGLAVAGDHTAVGVDDLVSSAVAGWPHGLLTALVVPTEPYVVVPVLALVAFRYRSLFAVLAPAVAVAVTTWVLKPLFDRWKGDTLVYPSGHTVGLVATLVVVFLLVDRRARTVTAVIGTVLVLAAALGMVGLGYHYVTDVVGGACFAVFAVRAIAGLWSGSGSGADSRWSVLSRNPWRG